MRHQPVSSVHDMPQLIELVAKSRIDALVGMTEKIRPPRADGIQVTLSSQSVEPDSFAPADRDQRQRLVLLHLV